MDNEQEHIFEPDETNGRYEFTEKPFSLKIVINDEELLELALCNISDSSEISKSNPIAQRIVVAYVLEQFKKKGQTSFSQEEVSDACDQLVLDHILLELSKKGMIEVNIGDDGQFLYSVTDKGKEFVKGELDD